MAFTERYVTTSGTAGHGGTNDTSDAWDFATGWAAIGSGIRLNIKAGAYTSLSDPGTLGTSTGAAPAAVRGYSTTPGDGYLGRDTNGKLITTNMPSLTFTVGALGLTMEPFCYVENCQFYFNDNATDITLANSASLINCIVQNASTGASAMCVSAGSASALIGCDISLTGASGGLRAVNITNVSAKVYGCRITGKNTEAIRTSTSGVIIGCTIFDSTVGVNSTATATACFLVADCTFYNCSTAAVQTSSTLINANQSIVNCHCTDCNRFINVQSTVTSILACGNRTRDNTNADANRGNWADMNYITTDNGTATSDYIDAATNKNFMLLPTAVGRNTGILRNRDIGGPQAPSSSNTIF